MQDRPYSTDGRKTFDHFLAFLEHRPDDERWELIDGALELNATPTDLHQIVVTNLIFELETVRRAATRPWTVLPGLGIHLPQDQTNAPTPDVMVRPDKLLRSSFCDDPIVVIEVLSPSTARKDLVWKRDYYRSLASVRHYLIVAQDEVLVRHYSRRSGWRAQRLDKAEDTPTLGAVGVTLGLADIYRDTGLA